MCERLLYTLPLGKLGARQEWNCNEIGNRQVEVENNTSAGDSDSTQDSDDMTLLYSQDEIIGGRTFIVVEDVPRDDCRSGGIDNICVDDELLDDVT